MAETLDTGNEELRRNYLMGVDPVPRAWRGVWGNVRVLRHG
jgi:hypothetical protein